MPLSFWQDLKTRQLMPIKVLLFLQSAGDMALYPFFTLHMKYLGISITEIGIQFALTPIATLISSPLVGLLADKIGNFKTLLSIALLICAAISQCLAFVPPVRMVPEPHAPVVTLFTCLSSAEVHPTFSIPKPDGRERHLLTDTFNSSRTLFLKQCRSECLAAVCSPGDPCEPFFDLEAIHEDTLDPFLLRTVRVGETLRCSGSKVECVVNCETLLRNETGDAFRPKMVADPVSKRTTFWLYLAIRMVLIVTVATEMSLLKAAILTMVEKYDSEYGYQRVWPTVATCIVPLVTGVIMDKLRQGDFEDYRPCFYIYGGMKVVMAMLTFFTDLTAKSPTLELLKNLKKLLRNPEVTVLLCYVTFVGSCWGFLETFLLYYLESLGASRLLMGLTFTVGSLSGIPTSIFAGAIERKIGHVNIIVIGLVAYAVRFVGYSYVASPYQALIFEVLECLTMSLMLVTITTYANALATNELVATMQATWAALHFAVGRALGSVVGGYMMDGLGSRLAYQMYAVKCLAAGLLYVALYYLWLRRRRSLVTPVTPEKTPPLDLEKNDVIVLSTDDVKNEEKLEMKYGTCNNGYVADDVKVNETILNGHLHNDLNSFKNTNKKHSE